MDLERILNCKLSPKKFSFTEDEIYVHDLQDKFGSYRIPDVHAHFFNISKSERRIRCKIGESLEVSRTVTGTVKSTSRSRSSSRESGKSASKKKQKKSSPSFLKRKGSTKDVTFGIVKDAADASTCKKSKKLKRAVSIETYTLSQRAEELQKMRCKKETDAAVEGLAILKASKEAVSCTLEGLPRESISGELSVSISYGSEDEKKFAPSTASPAALVVPASPISGTGTISKTYSSSSSASSLRERRKFPQLTVDVNKSNSRASWTRSIMDQLTRFRLTASTRPLK